jgi:hypothetical protein
MAEVKISVFLALLIGLFSLGEAPEQKEFRLDLLSDKVGYVGTLLAKKSGTGYALFEERGEAPRQMGFVNPMSGEKYAIAFGDAGSVLVIDLARAIAGFQQLDLKKTKKARFKCKYAGEEIEFQLNRSGSVVYLTEIGSTQTFSFH